MGPGISLFNRLWNNPLQFAACSLLVGKCGVKQDLQGEFLRAGAR
jgi:hypothetical protein